MVIVKRTHSAALRMYFNMIELCDLSELIWMKQFGKEARLLSCANYIQLKGDDKGISWGMGVKVAGFEKEKRADSVS